MFNDLAKFVSLSILLASLAISKYLFEIIFTLSSYLFPFMRKLLVYFSNFINYYSFF
jgi:hypothetical protein